VFPVVILGGLDSIGGALVGGLIVGVVESLAAGYLDPYVGGGTKDFAPYVLMILVLMVGRTASSAADRSSACSHVPSRSRGLQDHLRQRHGALSAADRQVGGGGAGADSSWSSSR
jgi:hypothetical protein